MLSKRSFVGCALCAAIGLASAKARAQGAQAGGLTRRELRRTEYPGNHVIIQMIVDVPAGVEVARHTHPGVESSIILEGELILEVQGQPTQTYREGDGFQVPASTPHGGRGGASNCKIFAHFIVEKDKPLASPA